MATAKLVLDLYRPLTQTLLNHMPLRNVVNVPPTATGKRRFRKEVETDPHKLVNYCCGLNFVQGSEPIKLKPDNEYPEWLWTLRLGPPPNSWELEEGTKEYYLQLKREESDRNYIAKMKASKVKKVVGKVLKKNQEYLHFKRFAALAHMEDDAGLDVDSMETDWAKVSHNRIKARDYYLPMDESRVLYMDKIMGNRYLKNYNYDPDSTFKKDQRMTKHPSNSRPAIQDSKRRHRYASN